MTLPPTFELPDRGIILLTGPSGSGKTTALRLLSGRDDAAPFDNLTPAPAGRAIVEAWPDPAKVNAQRLAAVGLGDPLTWAKLPQELSDGQQRRFALACRLADRPDTLWIDEFLATLDRPTARAVAYATGRAIRAHGLRLIAATSQDDLADDLCPDVVIRCGWDPVVSVSYPTGHRGCSTVVADAAYRPGDVRDWKALKHLHYAAGDPATVHSYHVLTVPAVPGPAAVAILSYPDLHSAARNLATADAYLIAGDRRAAMRLNREVLKLSRIVVTPELRCCGLAGRLVSEILARTPARWVECVTAMGPYSGWLERVGFRHVPQAIGGVEAELMDLAEATRLPAWTTLSSQDLAGWVDGQSVRVARLWRRLVWHYYHQFVLHRRARAPRPKVIPGPDAPGWPEAWELVARRITDRPAYYVYGPIDRQTGAADDCGAPDSDHLARFATQCAAIVPTPVG